MLIFAQRRIGEGDAVMRAAVRSAAVQHNSEAGCPSSGDDTEIRKHSHFLLYLRERQ